MLDGVAALSPIRERAPDHMPAPAQGRTETWTVGDRPRDVTIWTGDEWNALVADQRPGDAMMIGGIGWVVVLPEAGDPADPLRSPAPRVAAPSIRKLAYLGT
jgi:hypothetical protein